MPLFEYKCKDCGSKFEILQRSSSSEGTIICPECKSVNNKKLLSAFSAAVKGNSSASFNECTSGNCGIPVSNGCASGMCDLN